MSDYVIGADLGTDSVRSLLVDAESGEQVASGVYYFSRYKEGKYCVPEKNQFRHHPRDYVEGLERAIGACLERVPARARENVRGISVDTTGSTPGPVAREGTILALLPEFQDNPNAMFILWKDHTAVREAAEINEIAKTWGETDFTRYVGGVYSAEWFWAKILHTIRVDEAVRQSAYSWVELCDWVPAILTGNKDVLTMKRSRCAAGHKAMWHPSWGGLPSEEFLVAVDPLLKGLRERLYEQTYTSDARAGIISAEWAKRLGLNQDVVIGVGAFDAHMGAVGAWIKPYTLVKIMGTSTCDILVVPEKQLGDKLVRGICGQVNGSVIPGMVGLEAGQSAVGDVYAWFGSLLYWPVQHILQESGVIDKQTKTRVMAEINQRLISVLSWGAERAPVDESGTLALDWLNGRRTPDANQALKGAITGLSLGSDAPRIFRALVEATAFGARAINERFESAGIPINEIIATGGVSKSNFVMQVFADVLRQPIQVCRSEQVCALGAAMCAATASGIYKTIEEAQQHMNNCFAQRYSPVPQNIVKYEHLYQRYCRLGVFVEENIMNDKGD